jgi:hypothetical protein
MEASNISPLGNGSKLNNNDRRLSKDFDFSKLIKKLLITILMIYNDNQNKKLDQLFDKINFNYRDKFYFKILIKSALWIHLFN